MACFSVVLTFANLRDAKHIAAGDFFMLALEANAHLKMHLYLEREIASVTLDEFLDSAGIKCNVSRCVEGDPHQ